MGGNFSYLVARRADLGHHLGQATRWLTSAADDTHTVAISYVGFELRNEIELIATRYLRGVLGRAFTHADVATLSSFKKMENAIYAADGHQRTIDKKIEFMDLLIEELGMPMQVAKVNFGKLSDMWHRCSEYCHISWTLASSRDGATVFPLAVADLQGIVEMLRPFSQPNVAWPGPLSPEFSALRDRYVSGHLNRHAVVEEFRRQGIWGTIEMPGQDARVFRQGVDVGGGDA